MSSLISRRRRTTLGRRTVRLRGKALRNRRIRRSSRWRLWILRAFCRSLMRNYLQRSSVKLEIHLRDLFERNWCGLAVGQLVPIILHEFHQPIPKRQSSRRKQSRIRSRPQRGKTGFSWATILNQRGLSLRKSVSIKAGIIWMTQVIRKRTLIQRLTTNLTTIWTNRFQKVQQSLKFQRYQSSALRQGHHRILLYVHQSNMRRSRAEIS